MTTQAQKGEQDGKFPVGLRVLAVEDNPICLKVLETVLRKCQYNVTTAKKAADALKILRENNGSFDLVISDVHMPDIDGFKLLEIVGLEMDLPVIMLSADDNHNMVMKGIMHGACDYLVKPLRLEEVKNIWQHVVRRKKLKQAEDLKETQADDTAEPSHEKVGKKRKDEDEIPEDKVLQPSEEPSRSQKKTRLYWSPELHGKFIGAIHHLGIEKAVPKKILELMNDENITREHVASHLQKYRISLRKANKMANEQLRAGHGAYPSDSHAQIGMLSRNMGSANAPLSWSHGNFRGMARNYTPSSIISQQYNNNLSYASNSGSNVFGPGLNTSNNVPIPYRAQDVGTNFGYLNPQPCISRNQAWPSHSPVRALSNDQWSSATLLAQYHPNQPVEFSQASSPLPYNYPDDSIALQMLGGGEFGELECQVTSIEKLLQPLAEVPLLLPAPENSDVQKSGNEPDTRQEEDHLVNQETLLEKSHGNGCLEDLIRSSMKSA